MHESSLGRQVLGAVLAEAEKAGADKVVAVHGWIAETEHLDPAAIAFHFGAVSVGTLAEGAELKLDLRWVEARCDGCGDCYKPDHHLLLCPKCGGTEAKLLGETGICVERIDVV